jgi:hypothetical protein
MSNEHSSPENEANRKMRTCFEYDAVTDQSMVRQRPAGTVFVILDDGRRLGLEEYLAHEQEYLAQQDALAVDPPVDFNEEW